MKLEDGEYVVILDHLRMMLMHFCRGRIVQPECKTFIMTYKYLVSRVHHPSAMK